MINLDKREILERVHSITDESMLLKLTDMKLIGFFEIYFVSFLY